MKKIFSILAVVCFSMNIFATATVFDFNSASCLSQTADGFSVSLSQAGDKNTKPQFYNNEARMYANNTITISGEGLTKIEIIFTKQGTKGYAELNASTGTLTSGGTSTSNTDKKTDVWTGNANSVVFTLGASGQRIIRRVVINRAEGEVLPDEGNEGGQGGGSNGTDTLRLDYNYSEPTIVTVQGEAGNNKAYSFIHNNIKIDCTKGAIDLENNYFGCNAGEKITFSATKNIKGLTINGFAKKDFSATVNNGSITYMSDSEDAVTGDPVLVITDIDAKNVTISCTKQLRCYSVKFYFEANPTDTIANGNGGGEVYFLSYDHADAVYETMFSEEGEYNYTIFLYNDTADYPYIALDVNATELQRIEGTHDLSSEYSYYQYDEGFYDCTFSTEGMMAITKEGEKYTISGYITCDDNNTYNFTYSGSVSFYTDLEYYDDDQAIETAYPPLNPSANMHDILGRPVGKGYRGIVIQDGKKYLVR